MELKLKYQMELSWASLTSAGPNHCGFFFFSMKRFSLKIHITIQFGSISNHDVKCWTSNRNGSQKKCAKYSAIVSLISYHVDMKFHTTACEQRQENPFKSRTLSNGFGLRSSRWSIPIQCFPWRIECEREFPSAETIYKSVHRIGKFIFLQFSLIPKPLSWAHAITSS